MIHGLGSRARRQRCTVLRRGGQPCQVRRPLGYDVACRGQDANESASSDPVWQITKLYSKDESLQQAMQIVQDWLLETGPERQVFYPNNSLTQDVMWDIGVQRARLEYISHGEPKQYDYSYSIDQNPLGGWGAYALANAALCLATAGQGDDVPWGDTDPVGGVLGSYRVTIQRVGSDTALFRVSNETRLSSGTRIPGTSQHLLEDHPRGSGFGGTMEQDFYWIEPWPVRIREPWALDCRLLARRSASSPVTVGRRPNQFLGLAERSQAGQY